MRGEGTGGLAWGINLMTSAVFPIIDFLSQTVLVFYSLLIIRKGSL